MKIRIRKSSLKGRRMHGFRSKPGSYIKSKTKKKHTRRLLRRHRKHMKRLG